MRIACPKCSAEYDVPESLLAAGPRLLRCARCGHQFQAAAGAAAQDRAPRPPPATPTDTPPVVAPPPAPAPAPAAAVPPALPAEPPPAAAPAPLAAGEALVPDRDRPPPTRGPGRHSPIDPPSPHPLPDPDAPERPGRAIALAWLVSLAVLALAGWAAWHYQAEITAFWPPMARLYGALGLR